MSNSNHSAKFINMLIALMASIAIALTCIVPTALAEDGDGTDDNNGGSTVQPAGPVPNIIITNFTYGDGSVAVGTNFDLGFTFQNMGKVAVSNMVVTVDGGENFAISGGTNTFYYDSLWAGYSLTRPCPCRCCRVRRTARRASISTSNTSMSMAAPAIPTLRISRFPYLFRSPTVSNWAIPCFQTPSMRARNPPFHGIREQGQGGCIQCRSVHRG